MQDLSQVTSTVTYSVHLQDLSQIAGAHYTTHTEMTQMTSQASHTMNNYKIRARLPVYSITLFTLQIYFEWDRITSI